MSFKIVLSFMGILTSLFWLSMMVASQTESLVTPHARFLFLIPFVTAILIGVIGLCVLFGEAVKKSKK